jgi:hypothetical protein
LLRAVCSGVIADFSIVVAGLDPAIHATIALAVRALSVFPHVTMDHRLKPGGDAA